MVGDFTKLAPLYQQQPAINKKETTSTTHSMFTSEARDTVITELPFLLSELHSGEALASFYIQIL